MKMQRSSIILAILSFLFLAASLWAQGPPLIPRAVFDSPAEHDFVTISPDGKWLAYLAPSDQSVANIWVEDLATHEKHMVTHDQHRGIGGYYWAYDSTHLLYPSDENGNEDDHLYSVDLKTNNTRDLTPFLGVRAEQTLLSPAHPDELLVGMNLRDRKLFDIYRVNLTTGATVLEAQNPGDVIGWTADGDLHVRAATAFTDNLDTVVRSRESTQAQWHDILSIPFEQAPFLGQVNGGNIIVSFSRDGKKLVVGSSKDSPTIKLLELDAASGKTLRTIAGDPKADPWQVFATSFVLLADPQDHHIQAAAFNYLRPEWRAVDPAVEPDLKYLAGLQPGAFLVPSQNLSGKKWIVWYFSDRTPTSFYLYDREKHQAQLLFRDRPQLERYTLAEMRPLEIPARDGFKLVSYLTLPPGAATKDLPMVLLV